MKRPDGNKTNAEWMSEMCPYDLLIKMNDNMRQLPNTYACIMDAMGDDQLCRADNCEECIRLWRLEPYERLSSEVR